MPPNEFLELLDDRVVPAYGKVRLDPLLERRETQFLEPCDLLLRERVVGELGERRAAPEREGVPQRLCSPVGIVGGECPTALVEQSSKVVAVELTRLDAQQV